ncbi:MAG: hypothetical protein RR255_00380 [Bacilli bacterium]
MKIYLDMDEVMIGSIETVVKILNKKYGMNAKKEDITSWNFSNIFKDETNESIEEIFNSPQFFEVVKFKDGAKEFILENIDDITVITKGGELNLVQKGEWLEDNGLGDIKFIGLPLNKSKSCIDMKNNLFIDDASKNLKESNASIKILFENNPYNICEWNKDWNGLRVINFRWLSNLLNQFIY